MRILFTPMSWPTHYFPTVTTAWACRAAGHDVWIAAQPSALNAIIRSGMTAVAVGQGYDVLQEIAALHRRAREGGDQLQDRASLRALALGPHVRAAEASIDAMMELARDWQPDLVVSDPLILAAPLMAQAAGIPIMRHLWGPDVMRLLGFPGSGLPMDEWPESLVELYGRYGVEPREEFPVATIDPCPASLQLDDVPSRVPVRFVPYNGPGVIPAWVRKPAQRPRVLVTWGTAATERLGPAGFGVPAALEALVGLDVEVVVAVKKGDHELIGDPPLELRVVEDMPLYALLPTCSAIIHQGGSGTVQTAAYYGVPQVMVPGAPDQIVYTGQLANTGAGVGVDQQGGPDQIKKAVSSVLSDQEVHAAARRLQAEIMAQPTPAEVVAKLDTLL